MSFFEELKRRNVFKVGFAYLVLAWLAAQVLQLIFESFEAPDWVMKTVLILLATGFIFSLFLAWAFELTPDGIKSESELGERELAAPRAGHTLNYVIIGSLVVGVIYFAFFKNQETEDDLATTTSRPSIQTLISRPVVVVLPFSNTSGDESRDYIAFGMTDELIAGLQRYKSFPVASRNASFEYDVSAMSRVDFIATLGASYIVEGTVNTVGDGLRVLAAMSDAGGKQVWSERYEFDGGKAELFAATDELASNIATAVLESEMQRVVRTDRPPVDAWEHYIKGLHVVLNYNPDSYEDARRHLDQAAEIAPNMAEAWWALGELEAMKFMTRPLVEESALDELHRIISYFQKAHEISPFHAAACGCLGFLLTTVGQPDQARAVFGQAIEANPMSEDLRTDYATFLLWDGRYDEALENVNLALRLGAVTQNRVGAWVTRSVVALAKNNKVDALDAVNRAMFIRDDTFYTPLAVALLFVLGNREAAADLFKDMQKLFPDPSPQNPVFYTMLKPIDDILAQQREDGVLSGPKDVQEIYTLVSRDANAATSTP